jgi:hypothetical protein
MSKWSFLKKKCSKAKRLKISSIFLITFLLFLVARVNRVLADDNNQSFSPLATSNEAIKANSQTPTTTITRYYDDRAGAMALNYDTELYMCGMIHSLGKGYDPISAAERSIRTRLGWQHILTDAEAQGIPLGFNICGFEAVFGSGGLSEIADINVYQPWHSDRHWSTNTWYSDLPPNGGNYLTVGNLSGYTRSYGLIYGGDLTERTLNSSVPFEISFHNFGHESLGDISAELMALTFSHGVEFHKRIGSKIRSEAPPWDINPKQSEYPIYTENGIFVSNRMESHMSQPYEVIPNLWIIPRFAAFNASTDMASWIDDAIANKSVLANYSHPEDGFSHPNRRGFQASLAYAKSKVDAGELWATTLSEIGRYWEAKSDASSSTQFADGKTDVAITLSNYNKVLFGIPYLTFKSTMPDASAYARITVDYPSTQILNSNSKTVRVSGGVATYTIYLNPDGKTNVQIEGIANPYIDGDDINKPILTIDSTVPTNPLKSMPITIQANVNSTDAIYTANLIYQRVGGAKDSKIMTWNGSIWETTIGAFAKNDIINYYVSVTDNSGRRERSGNKSFSVISDTSLPKVETFTAVSLSNSLSIPITAFTAVDNIALSAYMITESSTMPTPSDARWIATAPATYRVVGDGSRTLFPWAKDTVGNVSAVFASPFTVFVDLIPPGCGKLQNLHSSQFQPCMK